MNKNLLLASIAISLSLQSCIFFKNCIKPEGEVVKHYMEIDEIHSIELHTSANLVIKQSDQQKIEVLAPNNYFEVLNKEVKGGEWEIKFDRCLKEADLVEIYLEVKELEDIEINGSGNIKGDGKIEGKKLEIEINGSGALSLEIDYKDVEIEIQGSGETNLNGESKRLDIEINGSGDVNAGDLIADETKVQINGSGDVKTHSEKSLEVEINGSGDVLYKGEPQEINTNINGSGVISPLK